MRERDFAPLQSSGLLQEVEAIVVDAHRLMTIAAGRPWSSPQAYRWLRYEDPEPVQRLADGVRKLRRRGFEFNSGAVDKACARASKVGYLN